MIKWVKIFNYFILLFLLAPIIVTILYSFNSSPIITIWKSFSFNYYKELFEDVYLLRGLILSIKVGILSATFSTFLGLYITNYIIRGKGSILKILQIQMMLPDVITGFGVLMMIVIFAMFMDLKLNLQYYAIIFAHTVVSLPYTVMLLYSKLQSFNQEIIESASDLGADKITIWLRIIIPMLYPPLITCWLIAFIISFDDVVLASFTSGPGATTLPLIIYSKLRVGVSPEVNSLATLMIFFNFIIISFIFGLRKNKI